MVNFLPCSSTNRSICINSVFSSSPPFLLSFFPPFLLSCYCSSRTLQAMGERGGGGKGRRIHAKCKFKARFFHSFFCLTFLIITHYKKWTWVHFFYSGQFIRSTCKLINFFKYSTFSILRLIYFAFAKIFSEIFQIFAKNKKNREMLRRFFIFGFICFFIVIKSMAAAEKDSTEPENVSYFLILIQIFSKLFNKNRSSCSKLRQNFG